MVKGTGCPAYRRTVAGIALGGGRNMGGRLHLRILCNESAAMAARARPLQTRVIHHRREPGDKTAGMAGIALGNCRYVIAWFT